MGNDGVTHPLNLVHWHVGIGGEGQVIGLEALVDETVDGRMNLGTHRLNNHAVDGVMMALTRLLEAIEAGNVALLRLLTHRQQLIGEATHCRYHHDDGFVLGVNYILEVAQALDTTDRGAAKFHHFHCYRYFPVISYKRKNTRFIGANRTL